MVMRHNPEIAVISNCYSEPLRRFPRVTHPCATRPEGLVRLACVRHAASVRSEPESNSQVDVRSNPRWNKREQDRHLREPFLHKKSQSGVFAFLRHMSSSAEASFGERIHKERLKFDRSSDTQRLS